jgi:hypothetical protein
MSLTQVNNSGSCEPLGDFFHLCYDYKCMCFNLNIKWRPIVANFLNQGGDSYKCISALTTISFKHIYISTVNFIYSFMYKMFKNGV